jgi:EmrB/QacA subfamily drug resistance transporter
MICAMSSPETAPDTKRRDSIILAIACVAQFMVVLDVSVVNVALPSIGRALHYSPTGLQWVVNAYVLSFAGFLLLGGRAADIYGRRRVFLFGVILFSLTSLIGGFAVSSNMLTGARVAQGLGGAVLSPATLTIIITTFRGPRLPKALGAWGAMGGAGGAVGTLLGGVLTSLLSWRWVLFINVPIGILLTIAAIVYLPELATHTPGRKLDVPGAVLVTAGLSTVVYAIVNTDTHAWGSSTTLLTLAIGFVLLIAFALVEQFVAKDPLVSFSFFNNRYVNGSNLVMFLIGGAFFSMWYFLTLYLQEILGMSALRTGFAFAPMAAAIIIGAQLTGRAMPKLGPWKIILAGTTFAAVGFFWLSFLTASGTYWVDVFGPAVMIAFALGLLFSPLAAVATSSVGHAQAGLASGVLNSARQIGGSLALAILATVAVDASLKQLGGGAIAHRLIYSPTTQAARVALTHGYSVAFIIAGCVCTLGLITTFTIPRSMAGAQALAAANSAAH